MFHMGRAWRVLRPFARELGRRLTEAGTLSEPDDVFYLRTGELTRAVRAIVSIEALTKRGFGEEWPHGARVPGLDERGTARRALRAARRSLVPPTHIPAAPVWARQRQQDKTSAEGNELKGAAVSRAASRRRRASSCRPPSSARCAPARYSSVRPRRRRGRSYFHWRGGWSRTSVACLHMGPSCAGSTGFRGCWGLGTRLRGSRMGRQFRWTAVMASLRCTTGRTKIRQAIDRQVRSTLSVGRTLSMSRM